MLVAVNPMSIVKMRHIPYQCLAPSPSVALANRGGDSGQPPSFQLLQIRFDKHLPVLVRQTQDMSGYKIDGTRGLDFSLQITE